MHLFKRVNAMNWEPDAKPKPLPWLVEGLILQGGINALLGPEKVGKSRLICWLLAHMLGKSSGSVLLYEDGEVFSNHNGFRKILYLNAEEQTLDVMARVNEYAKHEGFQPLASWPIVCLPAAGMQLHLQKAREDFEKEFLSTNEFDFIIIDPLRRVHSANENDNSNMAGFHNDLRRWSQEFNQTWLIVHHSGHFREYADMERIATWCRGATDLPAILDGAMMMKTLSSSKNLQHRLMKRAGRFPPESDLVLLDFGDPKGFVVQS